MSDASEGPITHEALHLAHEHKWWCQVCEMTIDEARATSQERPQPGFDSWEDMIENQHMIPDPPASQERLRQAIENVGNMNPLDYLDDGDTDSGPRPDIRNPYERMRVERGWPTPNHMRSAADALDRLVIPRYGDVLRWFADLCDEQEANR